MKRRNRLWHTLAILMLATPALAQDAGTPDPETLENAHPARPYSRGDGTISSASSKHWRLGV